MLAEAAGVALVLAVSLALAGREPAETYDWATFRRAQGRLWLLAVGVLAWVVVVEGAGFASLNHPPVAPTGEALVLGWIVVAGASVAVGLLFRLAGWDAAGPAVRALFGLSTHRKLLLAVSTAAAQSVAFPGYLLTRVTALTGSEGAGVAVSAVALAAVQAPARGPARLAMNAVLGVALGAALVVTGSLPAVAVAFASYSALNLATSSPGDLPDAGTESNT